MQHRYIITLYNELLKNLHGEWLLVGETLLHVLEISERVTINIVLAAHFLSDNRKNINYSRNYDAFKTLLLALKFIIHQNIWLLKEN